MRASGIWPNTTWPTAAPRTSTISWRTSSVLSNAPEHRRSNSAVVSSNPTCPLFCAESLHYLRRDQISRIRNENRRTRKPPTIKNSSPLAPLQLLPENLEVVLVGRLDELHVGGGLFHPD